MPRIIDAEIVLPYLEIGYREQQADWAETDPNKVSYIKNKPVIPAAQVQVDWNENDVNNISYIRNRTHYAFNYNVVIDSKNLTFSLDGNRTKCVIYNLTLSEGYYLIRIRGVEDLYECTKEGNVYTIQINSNPDDITFTYRSGDTYVTAVNTTTVLPHTTYLGVTTADIKKLNEVYIPDTITRNRDLATVAKSGSYTDLSDTPNISYIADTQIEIHDADADAHNGVDGRVSAIEGVIPSQTYDTGNELADKDFVNSSIATNTATFKGTFNLVNDLNLSTSSTQAQIGTALGNAISQEDNNDYSFVLIPTSDLTPTEIDHVDRYKYNGTNWVYEYTLNNSGFTAAQWAAINSGATTTKIAQIKDIGIVQSEQTESTVTYKRTRITLDNVDYDIKVPKTVNSVSPNNYSPVSSKGVAIFGATKLDAETFTEFQKDVILRGGKIESEDGVLVEPLRIHNAVNVYCANASNSIYKVVQDATVADTYFAVYDVSSYIGQTLYFSQSGSTRLRMCQTGSVTAQDFKTLIDGVTTPAASQHTVVQYSNCPWVHDYGSNPSALSNEPIAIQQGVTALIVYTGNAEADVELTSVGLGNAFLDTIDQTSVNAVQSNVIYTALGTKADKVSNATNGNFAGLDSNGNLTDSGKKASDFKTTQTPVTDPTASGNAKSFIDTISQDDNGVMTATKKTLLNALMGFGVGSCTTAASSTNKIVTLNNYELESGGFLLIYFESDVPSNSTLNVNNKGAKSILYGSGNITSGIIRARDRALFIYTTAGNYRLITTDRIAKESITSLSISGQTITITYADGTSSTITTQDTKNTAGSTDTSSKIYLVGATSQAANPQTYSDNEVYAQNGLLEAKEVQVNEAAKFVWDSVNQCMRITFN